MTTGNPPPDPKPGTIWVGATRYRHILAVGNEHVLYSNGGSFNRECKLSTFAAWARRQKAKVVNDEH